MNDLIIQYPELEDYLRIFSEYEDYKLYPDVSRLTVTNSFLGLSLTLNDIDLQNLSDSKKPKKKDLSYINDCGFTYKSYGEISINIFHPQYYMDETSVFYDKPLKFKIKGKSFEIGLASPLFVLLNEPIFKDKDVQFEFQNFTTIKVLNTNYNEIKDDVTKALYYVNSYYLKKIGFSCKTYHMQINEEDPLNLYENDIDDIFKRVKRRRIRTLDDLISNEPLVFYTRAVSLSGDEKFLCLYRIIEFFMYRARINRIKEIRFNTTVSDNELLMFFDHKDELSLLENLITETLNRNQKEKLVRFAHFKKLINKEDISQLSKALYKYRNSIVHAKEPQIAEAKIPDLFEFQYDNKPWIYIIDQIVTRCITKYNKTSG